MAEGRGLRVVASFHKTIDHLDNTPVIVAKVTIERAEGGVGEGTLMQQATKGTWTDMEQQFKTAAEAETWAKATAEKIRIQYTATMARINALEVPEDFEVYG